MTRTQVTPRTRARRRAARARRRRERAVGVVAVTAAAAVGLGVLIGLLSGGQWPWSVATYLRWPQTAVGVAATAALIHVRWWRTALAAGVVAAGLVVSVVAPITALTTVPAPAGAGTLRIGVYNTGARAGDVDAFAATVADADVDVAVLLESDDIADAVASRIPDLSRLPTPRSGRGAQPPPVVLSRRPWPVEVAPLGDTRPATIIRARLDGKPLDIVGLHPLPPVTRPWAASHDRSIDAVLDTVLPRPVPHVVACDCNAAPWSSSMRRLLDTGLRGPTVTPTFGAPLLGIPLDHVLLSDDVDAVAREVAAFDGSDHRMIVTEVARRPRSAGADG